ncbi:MAG: 5-formyltetrahydrofolate cyclo-ligase [Desulfitobacterium hafniense]|nr:5-formyltetrahydrofolate cyclo-ligase [Desulfitobacterium hafniense]
MRPINPSKKELRKKVLKDRTGQQIDEVQKKSLKIKELFLDLLSSYDLQVVMLYQDFRQEVQTQPIIEELLRKNITVLLPKTLVEERRLIPYRINNINRDLVQGAYGIWEPDSTRLEEVPVERIDMVVIPGVAFDIQGNRLGYGGGYYDRFLPTLRPVALRVALAFELQIVPEVYPQEHDCIMDVILTEERRIQR